MDQLIFEKSGVYYYRDQSIEISDVAKLYIDSGIKRPVDDLSRLQKMYDNSNLIISAWREGYLVGIARSVTDFSYCCYLSDLAVKKDVQKTGVGKTILSYFA